MWFNQKTEDTYNQLKDVKEIVAREYNVQIDIIKVDEHKDGYSDMISKRIIEGIDSCDLLIADLSYGNKNVHEDFSARNDRNHNKISDRKGGKND